MHLTQNFLMIKIVVLNISGSRIKLCNMDGSPKLVLFVRNYMAVGMLDLLTEVLNQACWVLVWIF